MYENIYSQISDALVDKGYIVIENALDNKLTANLMQNSLREKAYKKAGISASSQLHVDSSKRRDKILWIDADDGAQSEYLKFADGLRRFLNRSLYLGLTYYETHFAIYEEGDFYEKHLDAFRGSKNRVVTTVFYLNEEWSKHDGGELIVYDAEDEKIAQVMPKAGTLVVFLSDRFPHEVLPAKKKRRSIAGWFRIDKVK